MEHNTTQDSFPPGEDIREELESREWSQLDFAEILGLPANVVNDIIKGRRSITLEIATLLSKAFGTSAQFWMNLQTEYDLVQKEVREDDAVERKVKLFELVPIREMQKRGWIIGSTNIDILEAEVCQFLEIKKLSDKIDIKYAARKSDNYGKITPPQLAWLLRSKKLAKTLPVTNRFSKRKFPALLDALTPLRFEPEGAYDIPEILSQYGIRFLIVEHLPRTKIDGACFWLDENSPVIVLSTRYDRIDYFWFTLSHELGHIKNGDGKNHPLVETMIVGEDVQLETEKPVQEKRADIFASEFLVNEEALRDFVERHDGIFSKMDIIGFSRVIGVHPGIIVGQMHKRGDILYSHFRRMLVKIRDVITASAFTDGWGRTISI